MAVIVTDKEDFFNRELPLIRETSKNIITTNGTFDILHKGHLKIFSAMGKLKGTVIVCVNSDVSVKKYKGENRPINPETDRVYFLSRLMDIDYIILFDEEDPRDILSKIKPNFHVKSISGYKGIEGKTVYENGGEVLLVEDIEGYSTTALINKIKEIG